jgi:hypothetical protein
VPLVERLNRSRGWIVGTVYVGGGCSSGALESGTVCRWVGVGGDGVGEMGLGGEVGLLPRTSGLGALRKTPKIKSNAPFWLVPKWCVLDPT